MAALDAASGPVAEAMRMQGESRARILLGYVGRSVLPVAAADAGTRVPFAVLDGGRVVEQGDLDHVLGAPGSETTRLLIQAARPPRRSAT